MTDAPLFLGIGNAMRRDDGVGPWLAERLARAGHRARAWPGDGAGLVALLAEEEAVILFDATRSGAPAGTRRCFLPLEAPMPRPFFHSSTHEIGLAEAVEIARRIGTLPRCLVVHGIEGADFGAGSGLSAPVRVAAEALLAEIGVAEGRIDASHDCRPHP